MRKLSFGVVTLLLPALTALGFTVSGNVSGRTGIAITYVYSVPTSLDTFFVTIANPFNGNYSQGNLDSGSYVFFAFQDASFNLLPDPDESRGFYGGEVPQTVLVTSNLDDIDIVLLPPNTGGFSGSITYAGEETGATYIFAHRTNTFEGIAGGAGILFANTGNGDYTAIVDSFGVYYAYAFMDVNTNLQYDVGEPWDVYGDDLEPEPISIIQGQQFPDEVDFELVAISSVTPPVRVAQGFRLGAPYPNPFNAETTIPFTLERPLAIEIVAHNVLGRTVTPLASGYYGAGEHIVRFGNTTMASGLYLIELRAQNVSLCTPVVLLK